MTTAILGLIGAALTAAAGVWKLFSDGEAAANTPAMQAAAQAQQQLDLEQKTNAALQQGDLKTLRDLEAE